MWPIETYMSGMRKTIETIRRKRTLSASFFPSFGTAPAAACFAPPWTEAP